MKQALLFSGCVLLLLFAVGAKAQCELKPVIAPDNLILCPNATDSLYTTEVYDSYQWYKEAKMIEGATSRYLVVDQYNDAGFEFSVVVTKGLCKGVSEKVLVDGWVFASPTMSSSLPPRGVDWYGNAYYCAGDALTFTFMSPYTTNIQWYNHYEPIKGATEQDYRVTGNGSYTVCGAPPQCPDFIACQNIPVVVYFDSAKATVTRDGNTFIAGKAQQYQWSLNGRDIAGATKQQYTAQRPGIYGVKITSKYGCTDVSRPIFYAGLGKTNVTVLPNPAASYITVTTDAPGAAQIIISDAFGVRRLQVALTSVNQRINVGTLTAGTYMLQVLDKSNNLVATSRFLKQ